ncbi:MAG: serpin family protein [Bacteroidota bacterium]|nr:serpin family protein [Bacteroidota bacterium]
MKNLYLIASIMLALLLIGSCKYAPTEPPKGEIRSLTQTEKQLVSSADKFGLKLFQKVNELEQNKNLFISPLSVSLALGMTLNGANTSTYDSMRNTLELPDIPQGQINEAYKSLIDLLTGIDPKVNFKIANSIFYQNTYTFENDFIEVNKKYFDALVRGLNFNDPATVNIINQWVKDNTNGKIEKIVESIENDIVMFLINALYFKGTWKYEFEKNKTRDDWFIQPNGTRSTCKMMVQESGFSYFANEDFQAIDLPYGDGAFSMTIFLPKQNRDVNSFIASITESNWNNWLSSFTIQNVKLYLPKFKLEYEIQMKDVLTALGMGIAFDPGNADFTKLYRGPGRAYISKVKHKTFVDVYEEGTEAAAVTSVEIGFISVREDIVMRCDRPFVFVIREKNSNSILFIGKIIKP